jgi:cell division protein FtsQ
MKLNQEKIRIFFLTNQLLRKIKNFFNQKILPTIAKLVIFLLAFGVLSLLAIKLFKPVYIEKIYQKSSFYFFHYLNLDNQKFSKINISGNNHVTKEEIIDIVEDVENQLNLSEKKQYQPLISTIANRIKADLSWVNQVTITRNMPNILNISIVEYEPFAIWQSDDEKYLTDKDGNLIPYQELEQNEKMLILSGKGANTNAKSIFNIFAIDPNLSSNVYSATWISNRRWDIRFENGLLVKLPEDNISDAWKRLMKIYNMPGSILGLKIIDLRLDDKVYLEYNDSMIKELKNL